MGVPWPIVKSFIREATENPDFSLITDMSVAYAKLRTIQRGHFVSATGADGTVQISSKIGETEFHFAADSTLDRTGVMAVAESALELIEGRTVAQARHLLRRVKTTRVDFSGYRHDV